MMTNMLNGMFSKIAPGMCRLSMNGGIAVKTCGGYKSYNLKTGRLTNCDSFVFGDTEEMFFVIPTSKVAKGDIILVGGKPKCVIEAEKNRLIVINYEDSTIDTILPERHVIMGNTYFYGKIVSMFGNDFGKGKATVEIAKKLNVIMTELYDKVKDVEFLIMGIGVLAYDIAPIQASQFESDIRIAEQLDKIYFESGGGGNFYESYTAAWYFGLHHTDLDCWKRRKKGIIITIGDEPLNPYLPADKLKAFLGSNLQSNIETKGLYAGASEKFDIYHLAVDDIETNYRFHEDKVKESFGKYLDSNHLKTVNMNNLSAAIVNIITEAAGNSQTGSSAVVNSGDGISW